MNTERYTTLNQALKQILAVLRAEYQLEKRAKRGDREKFLAVLAKAPDIEPEEYDQL